eukprot:TRINITY_DN1159_c0_g1_i1.p1 TRINITY_DN1159_c0_g1~~TRINITY_DN1159_c0_g1_i1.p1  ORF type:complete len:194 (-),score=40.55 TRINITY_DN1159_c0_g1_i1:52-633(-)
MASSGDEFDEQLLKFQQPEIGPDASQKTVYAVSAFLTAAIPVYVFQGIFDLTVTTNFPIFVIITAAAAFGLTYAYNNVNVTLRNKLLADRERTVTINSVASEAISSGQKKRDLVKKKKDQQLKITSKESSSFSVMFNNLLFLLSFIVFAFFFFKNTPSAYNYILSVTAAAGIVSGLSTTPVVNQIYPKTSRKF